MPKTLYLVRHAKSDWGTGEADFDRPLNKRGLRDAPEMGRRMKKNGYLPDTIICSPAQRAFQTLEMLNLGIEAEFNENIYEASINELLHIVRHLDDRNASAMLIGHNPGMTWLAEALSGVRIENMPTCAVVCIELPSDHWKKAGTCPGRLLNFDYPKKTARNDSF